MKKKLLTGLLVTATLTLGACGNTETTTKEDSKQTQADKKYGDNRKASKQVVTNEDSTNWLDQFNSIAYNTKLTKQEKLTQVEQLSKDTDFNSEAEATFKDTVTSSAMNILIDIETWKSSYHNDEEWLALTFQAKELSSLQDGTTLGDIALVMYGAARELYIGDATRHLVEGTADEIESILIQ